MPFWLPFWGRKKELLLRIWIQCSYENQESTVLTSSLSTLAPFYLLFVLKETFENIIWIYLNSRNTHLRQFTNRAWMSVCLVTLFSAFSNGQLTSCKWGSVSISILNFIFRGYNLAVLCFFGHNIGKQTPQCKFYFSEVFTWFCCSFSISDTIFVALELLNQLN